MPRKPLSFIGVRLFLKPVLAAVFLFCLRSRATESAEEMSARFMGANSCASSACHGGGGLNQNQFFIWSTQDFHYQRPVATLTTARSKQIADGLNIKDPTVDSQCVTCHAPIREIPPHATAAALRVSEGVSCENCHGAAESWIRSHTRKDFSHADRVAAGMRDLKNLYVRANTCVACHQTVSAAVLKAGHPELIFELDGQAVSQRKHWRERPDWHGAQAWAVGQAAALREMLWQLETVDKNDPDLAVRAQGLLWLFAQIEPVPGGSAKWVLPNPGDRSAREGADQLARRYSDMVWSDEMTSKFLGALAITSSEFRRPEISKEQQTRRAERLVLAFDRLSPKKIAAGPELKSLFDLAQSIPDFDPKRFADAVEKFAMVLKTSNLISVD